MLEYLKYFSEHMLDYVSYISSLVKEDEVEGVDLSNSVTVLEGNILNMHPSITVHVTRSASNKVFKKLENIQSLLPSVIKEVYFNCLAVNYSSVDLVDIVIIFEGYTRRSFLLQSLL